jgi:hypothetical protein
MARIAIFCIEVGNKQGTLQYLDILTSLSLIPISSLGGRDILLDRPSESTRIRFSGGRDNERTLHRVLVKWAW